METKWLIVIFIIIAILITLAFYFYTPSPAKFVTSTSPNTQVESIENRTAEILASYNLTIQQFILGQKIVATDPYGCIIFLQKDTMPLSSIQAIETQFPNEIYESNSSQIMIYIGYRPISGLYKGYIWYSNLTASLIAMCPTLIQVEMYLNESLNLLNIFVKYAYG